jgi:hypothetical protein
MKKQSNALKAISLLLVALLFLTAFPAIAFALNSPPSMTASFQADGSVLVKTNDNTYAQKITAVKIDGSPLPNSFDELCLVSNGDLTIDAYCFQQEKEYSIIIIADGYENATVTVSNAPLSPPSMKASFQTDGSVVVKTNNNTYAQKITAVKIDGSPLPNSFDELCLVSNGNLIIDAYCFQQIKKYSITIIAAGYKNATVTVNKSPLSPPPMTASFQADGSVVVKTNNNTYAQKITAVKTDGSPLPNSFDELCLVSNGNLTIDAYCFQQEKEYSITIIATGYENATVTVSNVPLSPSSAKSPDASSTTAGASDASNTPGPSTSINEPAQTGGDSTPAAVSSQQESGALPLYIWIIIGILAAGVIALGVILILKKKKN